MSITDVIQQMSAAEGAACELSAESATESKRVSCVVVMDAGKVVGICTERDIVRLTANKITLVRSLDDIVVRDVMTSPVKTLEASAFKDIFAVLFLFRCYRIRHLPIVDDTGELIGIVTPASIRKVLRPANLLKMRRVADVMSQDVVQATTTASVMQLAQHMADNRVSCVVIVDATPSTQDDAKADLPVGIVTERDIVQFQALGLNLQKASARDVMSSPLFLLDPQDSLWAAHEAMQSRRVRRLVVSWNWGQGLGIVTQTSLLRVFDPIEMCGIIDSLQQTLHQIKQEDADATQQDEQKTEALPNSHSPDNSAMTMLSQASQSIASAQQQTQFTAQQTQKLEKAIQLIQEASTP